MRSNLGNGRCNRPSALSVLVYPPMDNHSAQEFLGALLGKQLRIHTTDDRMFIGDFKCTDNVSHTEI